MSPTAFSHILVVDDDARLRDLLRRYLSEAGFVVSLAEGAEDARRKMAFFRFDAAIVDVMMPGEDGRALTRSLRRTESLPVLMLTAMGEVDQRIAGLEAGADDYLAKPFEPKELLLRLQGLLRRAVPAAGSPGTVRFGPFQFDPDRLALTRQGAPVGLTPSEALLLRELCRQPGQPVSRGELARSDAAASERSVDVQITRLRRRIEDEPGKPRHILTVRGEGYVLME